MLVEQGRNSLPVTSTMPVNIIDNVICYKVYGRKEMGKR